MVEIAIRVVDKINTDDANLDKQCLKRGHVVAVQPDGWGWSEAELSGAEWKIIYLPGVSADQVAWTLQGPEDETAGRRNIKLDISAWEQNGQNPVVIEELVSLQNQESARSYYFKRTGQFIRLWLR